MFKFNKISCLFLFLFFLILGLCFAEDNLDGKTQKPIFNRSITIKNENSYDEVYIVVPKGFGKIIKDDFIFYINNEKINIKLCVGDDLPDVRFRGSRTNKTLNADIFTFVNEKGRQKKLKYNSKIKVSYSSNVQNFKYTYGKDIFDGYSLGSDAFSIRIFAIKYQTEEERVKESEIKAKKDAENELMKMINNN